MCIKSPNTMPSPTEPSFLSNFLHPTKQLQVNLKKDLNIFPTYIPLLICSRSPLFLPPAPSLSEANKVEIVEYGAIGPLLALTKVSDPRVQRNTTGALLNLTHIGQYTYIHIAHSPNGAHHRTESNREKLVQAGGVAVFVHLLDSKDADVQFYCAAALSNLAVHGMYIDMRCVYLFCTVVLLK